jgi:hypothetical protein
MMTPQDVKASSHKWAYFVCPNGHSSNHKVYQMVKNGGCKMCAGQVATPDDNLEVRFPEIAAEWHSEKNGELTPSMVKAGSSKRVWWSCPRGHAYEMSPNKRTSRQSGCSRCRKGPSKQQMRAFSEVSFVFGDTLFNLEVESMEADIWIPSLGVVIELDGYPWHLPRVEADDKKFAKWKAAGLWVLRLRDDRLPAAQCHGSVAFQITLQKNDIDRLLALIVDKAPVDDQVKQHAASYLAAEFFQNNELYRSMTTSFGLPPKRESVSEKAPEVAAEWDYARNAPLIPEVVSYGSNEKGWFICSECGHNYAARIDHRVLVKSGCPACAGREVTPDRSLAALHPELAKKLHPTLNGDIDPYTIAPQSNKPLYWLCDKGHVYKAPPNRPVGTLLRTGRYSGCKKCYHESGRRQKKGN